MIFLITSHTKRLANKHMHMYIHTYTLIYAHTSQLEEKRIILIIKRRITSFLKKEKLNQGHSGFPGNTN